MPRRSNEFQHLVAMLTELSSDGAAVHESVELMEIASTETREVDVVAIGEVAGHQTVVCIECRDWKRPQTVEWVEQARTKFDDWVRTSGSSSHPAGSQSLRWPKLLAMRSRRSRRVKSRPSSSEKSSTMPTRLNTRIGSRTPRRARWSSRLAATRNR
jgi:hypothetical protein